MNFSSKSTFEYPGGETIDAALRAVQASKANSGPPALARGAAAVLMGVSVISRPLAMPPDAA
jgi:hypothetical protein